MKICRLLLDDVEYYGVENENKLDLYLASEVRDSNGLEKYFFSNLQNIKQSITPHEHDIEYLPPIAKPGKVICVGRNYMDHIQELGNAQDVLPLLFTKYPSNATGHTSKVTDLKLGEYLDYEVELAVIIGKDCFNLEESSQVSEFIFGYTVANDLTYRDIQKSDPGKQWTRGKAFERSLPIGPFVVTKDEIDNPQNLDIWLTVNGEKRQFSNTKMMIHSIDKLIRYISKFTSLHPGDLVLTGTPSGVGFATDPPSTLHPGDEVACGVENICELRFNII